MLFIYIKRSFKMEFVIIQYFSEKKTFHFIVSVISRSLIKLPNNINCQSLILQYLTSNWIEKWKSKAKYWVEIILGKVLGWDNTRKSTGLYETGWDNTRQSTGLYETGWDNTRQSTGLYETV